MSKYSELQPPSKICTGIEGFEHLTIGGLTEGRTTLLVGSSGSGKTLFGVEFLYRGVTQFNRNGVFITFEEGSKDVVRNVKRLGWNLGELVDQEKLALIDASTEPVFTEEIGSYDLEGLVAQIKHAVKRINAKLLVMDSIGSLFHQFSNSALIRREIENFKPDRLIMDSVSAMERVSNVRNFREFVIGLSSHLKTERICSLFTSTTPQLSGGDSITEAHISTITDVIILLRYVETGGVLRRGIAVIKMRGSQHDKQIREFTIDDKGMHIGEPFKDVYNIILGVPSGPGVTERERLEGMFEK